MSSPVVNSPGTRAQGRGEPWGPIPTILHELPGLPGGVHAPGPFGQIEQGTDPARPWWPRIPASGPLRFQKLELKDATNPILPADNYIDVDRPTIGQLVSIAGSLAGGIIRMYLSPGTCAASVFEPASPAWGVEISRQTFLIPAAGRWTLRCVSLGTITDFANLALLDATGAAGLGNALLPHFTTNAVISQGTVTITAATNILVYSTLNIMPCVALDLINVGANPVRLNWGGTAASATQGYHLTATGTFGDRLRLESPRIPLAELRAFSTLGSTLVAIRYI